MIRRYIGKDCEVLIALWSAASAIATPFLSDEFLAEERDNIRQIYLPTAESWVFETDGIVRGFISLLGHEVGGFFVHPKFQGCGIGRALMDHAVQLHGSLYLDVFSENAIGRRFYHRYGFRYESETIYAGHLVHRLRLNV